MKKRLLLMLLLLLLIRVCTLYPDIKDEYHRKAALLKIISEYVKWPKKTGIKDRSRPFVLGLIGENPFGNLLKKAFIEAGNRIYGKVVEIRPIDELSMVRECHILFISRSRAEDLDAILDTAVPHSVLTIGESDGFAARGVLINFYIQDEQIRFEINTRAMKKSGLSVSSQLLSVARIVNPPEDRK